MVFVYSGVDASRHFRARPASFLTNPPFINFDRMAVFN